MLLDYTTTQTDLDPNPPSRVPLALAVNIPLIAIAVLVVTLRLIVKGRLKKLAIEDALIVPPTLITIALVFMTGFAQKYGWGVHMASMQPEWWPMHSTYNYATTVLGSTNFPMTKLSMLFFYLRLATLPTPRKVIYATIGYIAISSIICTTITIFQCTPIRGAWNHNVPNLKCLDISHVNYFQATLNVVTDILLVAIPIPIIMKMQLKLGIKLALIGMFVTGILITIVSAYGMYTMYIAYHSPDATWDGMYTWMWALAEYNTGIIVACMPSMLLFLRWVRGDMDGNKKPISGSNPTIGGGGVKGRPARKTETLDMHTSISIVHENDEYGMRDEGGIMKSEELVIVETASDREGSMC
ncbi:hypothetical protein Q9L58_002275 [Maublancomyces gigas]|uniref:Rhodopsin domain-containing protein n=1 Tax=Discina gigas TaxID=1032678 RepID=A0ABR3GSJ7_9PEZI